MQIECVEVGVDDHDLPAAANNLNRRQRLLFSRARESWRPPERLTLSEWAAKYYQLESGRFVPIKWQEGILDAFTDSSIDEISFMKSARVGATESMVIASVYYASQDPMHLMILQPTEDDAKGFSTDKIGPTFDRCKPTKTMLANATRNTLTHKVFPGGSLKILAAKSPRNLRRHDVDVLMFDECDGYETTSEGDPIELGKRRTQNSNRRKIFYGSTPVNVQTSKINRAWEDSDKRYYYVPCPHCGATQPLSWDNVCIDKTLITKVHIKDIKLDGDWRISIKCRDCEEHIYEDKKRWMIDNGEWIATAPFTGNAGFHINVLYSTFPGAAWSIIALEYLRAKRSPDTLQTFVNTALGLPWSDSDMNLDEDEIYGRRTDFSISMIPSDIRVITAGVDIQKDRAEITLIGWDETRAWVIGHEKVYGDPTGQELWDKLDSALEREFQHELGGRIHISAAAVDSGNWTQKVYAYCAGREMRGIYAIKGVAGPRPIWTESKIRPGTGGKLYNVGVDSAKTVMMQRLSNDDPDGDGYVFFSNTMDREYYDQLLAEYREVKYVKNVPKFTWERKQGRRAEALDCWVYALAARETLVPNWEELAKELSRKDDEEKDSGFASLGSRFKN